jgi:hypothetical protein
MSNPNVSRGHNHGALGGNDLSDPTDRRVILGKGLLAAIAEHQRQQKANVGLLAGRMAVAGASKLPQDSLIARVRRSLS